jgi:hypothetical protein
MYLLQIKIKDGVIKEFLRFHCFIIMFLDGDCIKITIRILQIRLHLLKKKKTQTNKIRIRVTGARYSLQQQQERQKERFLALPHRASWFQAKLGFNSLGARSTSE